jgi:small subunit ribosomal protein S6
LKEYEAVFILSPKLSKEDVQKVADTLKKSIESAKGKDIVETKTERRPLNFAIKKQREGIYMIYKFTAPPDAIEKVKEDFKHNESVLRYAFIAAYKKEEPKPVESTLGREDPTREGAEKEK